jgi:hypothetical protein
MGRPKLSNHYTSATDVAIHQGKASNSPAELKTGSIVLHASFEG